MKMLVNLQDYREPASDFLWLLEMWKMPESMMDKFIDLLTSVIKNIDKKDINKEAKEQGRLLLEEINDITK